MNRLDDFFNKKLTNYSEDTDGWNIPDDAIWERALEQIPQKKTRRSYFAWWLFGLGIFLGFVSGYFLSNNNESTEFVIAQTDKVNISENNDKIITTEESTDLAFNTTNTQKKSNLNRINDAEYNKVSKVSNLKNIHNKDRINQTGEEQFQEINKHSIPVRETVRSVEKTEVIRESSSKETSVISDEFTKISKKDAIATSDKLNSHQNIPLIDNSAPRTVMTLLSPMNRRPLGTSLFMRGNSRPIVLGEIQPLDEKRKWLNMPREEVGVSRSFYLLDLLDNVDFREDPRDEIAQSTIFKNINFNYRKWLRPRLSFQSGLYYTKLDGMLDFSVFDKVEEENLDNILDSTFENLTNQSTVNVRSTTENSQGDISMHY